MTRWFALLALLVVVLPGCGGGSNDPIPPENPTTNSTEEVKEEAKTRTLEIPAQGDDKK